MRALCNTLSDVPMENTETYATYYNNEQASN